MWQLIDDPEACADGQRVAVCSVPGGVWVGYRGGCVFVAAAAADAMAHTRPAPGRPRVRGMQTVRAPMVGRVVEILVPPKQACQAGETLVVLEAMKMEYRLTAPADGTVQAVLCQVGDWVELDAAVVQVHCAQPADEADEPPARAVK